MLTTGLNGSAEHTPALARPHIINSRSSLSRTARDYLREKERSVNLSASQLSSETKIPTKLNPENF